MDGDCQSVLPIEAMATPFSAIALLAICISQAVDEEQTGYCCKFKTIDVDFHVDQHMIAHVDTVSNF